MSFKHNIKLHHFLDSCGLNKHTGRYSIKHFCRLSQKIGENLSKIKINSCPQRSDDIDKDLYDTKILSNPNSPSIAAISTQKYSRYWKDFMQLTKLKLCILNSVVAISTYGLYSTELHCLSDFFLFFNGTMCIAMASQVLNQITEKHEDSQMKRTCGRPLPKQRISDKTAFKIFGGLWIASAAMYSMTCPHAILFSNFILAMYNGAYTPQKKFSNLSMHLGAIVGALPALLGNFAATGILLQESSLLLALYVFAWQYVHFYGILYNNKDDYKKAGFKFISNDDSRIIFSYIQMLIAMALMIYCAYKLYNGKSKIMGPVNLALFSYFYLKSLVPVLKFYSNPQKYAKPIIIKSYAPFMIILGSYLTSAYYIRKEIWDKKVMDNNISNQI